MIRTVVVAFAVITCVLPGLAAQAQIPAGPATALPMQLEAYQLQPGDVVELKFFYNPELNEVVPVRPDGRIALMLINEVQAAGRTPSELRAELVTAYGATLKQPEIAVIVKEFAARRIYVGGEVRTPSLLRVPGVLTLLQAIFEAGGLTRAAKATDVVVLRYQGTPEPLFMKVNLEPALERGDPAADIQLQPFDIVWIPKTRIAKVNDFMDQYVRQLVPIPLTLGVSYVFGGLRP